MEVELAISEEMKEAMESLTLGQLFTRVTCFMEKTGAVEAQLALTGEDYECELLFKERKEQN